MQKALKYSDRDWRKSLRQAAQRTKAEPQGKYTGWQEERPP